ncbi:MAG: hypothetical protein GTO45_34175 [Candidatus Aminicenantes bacterium]|nr:hypothetical protein [Candidatus Aminicenantes bacterium]NIM83755.1 hypothetical protein [Candidatus Aminicenantes bacterium]NIN23215.1 hypothetical protein [Candidatus Aminicenantes bacterium]NIN46909.1 hypothetical protein [Candidatus Aminicenantes bacterium]NIN89831.1 hypothetical protein [Candidatus Aminicenantes bacterium]
MGIDEGLNYLQTFNPIESKAELLEKTLIGRKDLVDLLEKLVIESATTGNKHQRLIIGPRGSGKTHLLRVLYNRVSTNSELKDQLKIAYLCEDEYGIASFLDFIVRILRAFIKWEPEHYGYLEDEIDKLKKVPTDDQEKVAVNILLKHIEGTTLLIIVENIGNIFTGIKDEGQRKLRDLVQQNPVFTFMASNQALFAEVQYEDKPFHNFFKITHLKKLTLEETVLFLKSIAQWEKRTDLLEFLDDPEGRGRISAVYDITGGNHRLLVTFYHFLKIDYKNRLSYSFIKTINDLIPYYQSFMNLLAAQQQKIIQYLCQVRKPSNVKEIAENCFSTPNTISKQMSTLVRLKYVDASSAGKETFYELSEPLLRICFEVKENRGGPVKLFIDFLGHLYSSWEIKQRYSKYHLYRESNRPEEGNSLYPEVIKSDLPNDYTFFNIVTTSIRSSNINEALQQLDKALQVAGEKNIKNEIIQNFEESLNVLLIHTSKENISTYLRESLSLIEKYGYVEYFYKALPQAIFNLLIDYGKIEINRFEFVESILNEIFKENPSMIVPLKFLNIGIRHLKKKEKNALFQFTKEERQTFKKFVLDKI